MCVGFQRILDSDYALQRPDLAMWFCLVRSYSHTDATSTQYANAVNRFGKWLQETFNQSLEDVVYRFRKSHSFFTFVIVVVIGRVDMTEEYSYRP